MPSLIRDGKSSLPLTSTTNGKEKIENFVLHALEAAWITARQIEPVISFLKLQ